MAHATRQKIFFIAFAAAFIVAELVLAVCVQAVSRNERIQFASVVLCLAAGTVFCFLQRKFDLTVAALVFTVTADTFLVLLDDYYLIAVIVFSCVQLTYCAVTVIRAKSSAKRIANLVTRAALTVVLEIGIAAFLKEDFDALIAVAVFYFVNLFANVAFAFIDFKANPAFAVGLLLFMCCDAAIGCNFAVDLLGITDGVAYAVYASRWNVPWLFYIPSQLLLALSVIGGARPFRKGWGRGGKERASE
ncbi:MAG: hypothetical protein LBS99_04070 [Clostridiales bacterium]|jgi:hypothetical protein|nr:hypothetical protein [Clostridiales bacterium]